MHDYNYIPVCKSIRIHGDVFSDWSEFKSFPFELALQKHRENGFDAFQVNVILLMNFLLHLDKKWPHYL